MFYKFITICSLLISSAYGGIVLEDNYQPFEPIIITCDVDSNVDGVVYDWNLSDTVKFVAIDGGKRLHVWAPPGTHDIDCTVVVPKTKTVTILIRDAEYPDDISKAQMKDIIVVEGVNIERFKEVLSVGDTIPTPSPQPDPTPEPTPEPVPVPDPIGIDPIEEIGLNVIIIEETDDRIDKVSREQLATLKSTKVKELVLKQGGDFRQTDDDSVTIYENPKWAKVMSRPRESLPWMVASNDKQWYEGPVLSLPETLKLIESYK